MTPDKITVELSKEDVYRIVRWYKRYSPLTIKDVETMNKITVEALDETKGVI